MDGLCVGHGTAIGDDTQMAAQPFLTNLNVQGFHAGILLNDAEGHIHLDRVNAGHNFYVLYAFFNNGDLAIVHSSLIGNMMAAIACPPSGGCLGGGARIYDTLLGFQPYGIWGENGGVSGNFLQDVNLIDARFEAIGCGAIAQGSTLSGQAQGSYAIKIDHPGFSWNSAEAGSVCSNPNFAIDLDFCGGIIIDQGDFPLTPGPTGPNPAIVKCQGGNAGVWFVYQDGNQAPPATLVAGSSWVVFLSKAIVQKVPGGWAQ